MKTKLKRKTNAGISHQLGLAVVVVLLSGTVPPFNVAANTDGPAETLEVPAASTPAKPLLLDLTEAMLLPEFPPLGNAEQFLPGIQQTIRLAIKLGERRVYVYSGDTLKTSYPIAIGKGGWETPTGNFKVIEKQKDPAWQHPFKGTIIPPGRNNPLGTRWIGFWTDGKNYIGFHGTPNVASVGRPASHGCIRMFDKDVQQLFELVTVGTPVVVTQ